MDILFFISARTIKAITCETVTHEINEHSFFIRTESVKTCETVMHEIKRVFVYNLILMTVRGVNYLIITESNDLIRGSNDWDVIGNVSFPTFSVLNSCLIKQESVDWVNG